MYFCVHGSVCPSHLQLKPVRSLESFKHSSSTSPDADWAATHRSRTGAPAISPSRLLNPFSPDSYETGSLLLQSSDDVFTTSPPPPAVPPRPVPPKDLFGSAPFVVGGGQNENGDTVFLVASENSVDMVKLSPPAYSPRRKVIVCCHADKTAFSMFYTGVCHYTNS